jgi:type III secretion system FlhB-like substrate exporter
VSADHRPPTRVVGLRYDGPEALPTVVLKGSGPLADELLRERTRRADAPALVHDPKLVDALFRLPVDAAIGPDLFHAIAAILAHVLAVDASQREVPNDG